MSLRKDTYQHIIEFNKKTFYEKLKRRQSQAKLPFEEKLKIIEELNALRKEWGKKRANRHMKNISLTKRCT